MAALRAGGMLIFENLLPFMSRSLVSKIVLPRLPSEIASKSRNLALQATLILDPVLLTLGSSIGPRNDVHQRQEPHPFRWVLDFGSKYAVIDSLLAIY